MKKYIKLDSKDVINNKFVIVKEEIFKSLETGKESPYYILEFTDWVNVVPITKNNEVILIKQFRVGIENFCLEIPGGVAEVGEEPKKAAERELLEETGCKGKNLILLNKVSANPAYNTNYVYGYMATDCEIVQKQNLDENEEIEIIKYPLGKIPVLIKSGELHHPYAIISLMMVFNKLDIDYKL